MTPEIAASKVADRFVKNTQIKQIDPAWIVALVEIIIYVIKYCEQKKDLQSFKNAVKSGNSALGKYYGLGRRVRASLRKAVLDKLAQANCEELINAMLETAADSSDDEILGLIKSVEEVNYTP